MTPERLLVLAQQMDGTRYGGMSSIHIQYHPYKAHWEAQASWSSGETVTVVKDKAIDAIESLGFELLKTYEGLKG